MKCLLCPIEIDELKSFPSTPGPQGQMIEDVVGKWKHGLLLAEWTHVALTAQMGGGSMSILSGHVCPAHTIKPGCVALVAAPVAAAPKSVEAGNPPAAQPKSNAPTVVQTQTAIATPKGKENK